MKIFQEKINPYESENTEQPIKKEKDREKERNKEKIEINQLLSKSPIENDPIYKELKDNPTRKSFDGYDYCVICNSLWCDNRCGGFHEKIEDNIEFLLPHSEFKSSKNYEKIIIEVGCGIPIRNKTFLDKFNSKLEYKNIKRNKELIEFYNGILNNSCLYVGIDIGRFAIWSDKASEISQISQEITTNKIYQIYQKENVVIIVASIVHILPFIRNNSVDAIIDFSAGDIPAENRYHSKTELMESYCRIIKPAGNFFVDTHSNIPKYSNRGTTIIPG